MILWIALVVILGFLYWKGVIGIAEIFLISVFFYVADLICVLIWCPFRLIMKNKCCTTCRIYNWDYAMMFTPLVFIPNIFTWSLLGISLLLLIEWEVLYKKFPERFVENCNSSLSCINCQEKLCHHKKQLQHYLKNGKFNLKGNVIFKKKKD